MEIGEKVKIKRKEKNLTIKRMSELTGLSTGFISQFERGITTIDVDHLSRIAEILEEDITSFFTPPSVEKKQTSIITRSYERQLSRDLNHALHFDLLTSAHTMIMAPEYVEIRPFETKHIPNTYSHDGEEFIFVLEGILTFYFEDVVTKLYPGDSAHFQSSLLHNWTNMSDSVVKMIVVHAPIKTIIKK